jgi:ABC-type uncharacterized transport system fused permease/ATPase subunit
MQIGSSFNRVETSLAYVAKSYKIIAQWKAETKRLIDLLNTLHDLHQAKRNSKIRIVHKLKEKNIRIERLTAQLPLSINVNLPKIIIKNFKCIFEPYQSVLITGKNNTIIRIKLNVYS